MDDRWVNASTMAVAGAGCGVVATAVMSTVMVGWQRLTGGGPLAPGVVTGRALDTVGARPARPGVRTAVHTVAHFAFGSVAGAGYGALTSALPHRAPRLDRVPPVVRGALYGFGLWAVSHGVAIPRLGLLAPPPGDRPGRQARLITAHLLYGATLGVTVGV